MKDWRENKLKGEHENDVSHHSLKLSYLFGFPETTCSTFSPRPPGLFSWISLMNSLSLSVLLILEFPDSDLSLLFQHILPDHCHLDKCTLHLPPPFFFWWWWPSRSLGYFIRAQEVRNPTWSAAESSIFSVFQGS